ncbi:MAG: hypothetical protein JWN04_4063 [Myxococcaceae bacterium]|nr:hypothetical protein [Myxococcaceae bacterium]
MGAINVRLAEIDLFTFSKIMRELSTVTLKN